MIRMLMKIYILFKFMFSAIKAAERNKLQFNSKQKK